MLGHLNQFVYRIYKTSQSLGIPVTDCQMFNPPITVIILKGKFTDDYEPRCS